MCNKIGVSFKALLTLSRNKLLILFNPTTKLFSIPRPTNIEVHPMSCSQKPIYFLPIQPANHS